MELQLDSCVSYQTIPDYLDYLDEENINTPGVCLARCRDRNYTYAGLGNAQPFAGCYCAHASPEYAMVHPSQCSQKCPGTNETCGAHKFFSVVGPGYPSIPAYCAHVESLPYFQYYDDTLQLGPEDCVKKCASRGHFSSAGLKGPRCYCGARLPARENAVEESKCDAPCDSPEHGCGGEDVISVYKVNKTSDAEYLAPEPPGLDWQLDSCVSKYTIPDYLDDRSNNTPGVCLDRCRDRNYTYAGVMRYECYCGHVSPEFARVHPSQCSGWCPGDDMQTCGGRGYATDFFSVVGPGYPSIPAYCAHASSLPYFQYDSHSLGPKHCVKTCAFGHPDALYATGGYQYATMAERADCSCGSLAPPSYLVVDKAKCDKPCRWIGVEKVARQWRTKDISAPEVEYFDPRLIGTSAEWYGDSGENHEADTAEWLCGGSEELGGVTTRRSYYKSVYKLTLTAPVDNGEEDSGTEVSSIEDSGMEG